MYRYTKLSLIVLTVVTGGAVAYAANRPHENDALAVTQAKISLAQAVAEQHTGGKASRAEYENSRQGWVFDVEVVNGAKVFDVRVDADNGHVIASAEDSADRDDEKDERD